MANNKIGVILLIVAVVGIFLWYSQRPQIVGSLTSGTGSAQIALTDSPIDNVKNVFVTVDDITLHVSDGGANTKLAIQPFTIDLLSVQNLEQIIGNADLPAGHYTQIRLTVSKAKVVFNDGTEKDATIPSGKIKVVGQYEIKDKEETQILLDFDAGKSLVIANDKVILKPFIKMKRVVENNKVCKDPKAKKSTLEETDNKVETQSIGDTFELVMNKVDKQRCTING